MPPSLDDLSAAATAGEAVTNGQQRDTDYTAGAELARNIASYVSDSRERRNVYLAARIILNDVLVVRLERVREAGK